MCSLAMHPFCQKKTRGKQLKSSFLASMHDLISQEATRYERADRLSTSIKNPNETISLVEKSTGFLFCADVF